MGIIKDNIAVTRESNEKRACNMLATWYANTSYFIDNGLQDAVINTNATWKSEEKDGNRVLWVDLGNKKRFSAWLNPVRDEKKRVIPNSVMVAIRFGHALPLADELYKAALTVTRHNEAESFNNKHEYRLCVTVNQLKTMLDALTMVMNSNADTDIKPAEKSESVAI